MLGSCARSWDAAALPSQTDGSEEGSTRASLMLFELCGPNRLTCPEFSMEAPFFGRMGPMSLSLISRWFQPQKFESMPGYTVKKSAADNMLKSSVPEPQRLAPKTNCELAPGRGLEP